MDCRCHYYVKRLDIGISITGVLVCYAGVLVYHKKNEDTTYAERQKAIDYIYINFVKFGTVSNGKRETGKRNSLTSI